MITSGTTPQYQQIADTLRRRIARAEYAEGNLIPSSIELEQTFDVSNITIRKALALLSEDGWITGRRGIGTVVNAVPRDLRLKIAVSGDFTKWVDTASDSDLADLLQVSFGTPLFFVENIYTDIADTVVAVSHLYLRGDHYAHQTSIDMVG